MTDTTTTAAAWAAIALAIGLIAGWWAARRQGAAQSLAAAERATAAAAAELATLRERARSADADRAAQTGEVLELRRQADAVRDALDAARDERAQAAERAARVAPLEQQLAAARADAAAAADRAAAVQARVAGLEAQAAAAADALAAARTTLAARDAHIAESAAAAHALHAQVAELTTRLSAEREQAAEKLALLNGAREALANQFKALAADILEEKSKKFTEQNQANLGTLLDPLRTRLSEFQGKVEQLYDTEGKQRAALGEQVTQLMALNQLMSAEAKNLTQALKGSSKTQGNWGELILERVLEASGLRRGIEYHVQQSHVREDGSRAQPDVVVHLPEERKLVVDAKVSLLAYEECVRAEDDALRAAAQKRHLLSIRTHIDGLSGKRYQELYGLKSLDFVLMFVPIEPAFMLAVQGDDKLFMDAWARNVLLVSPSTLLFVVRTVAHLWRQEAQNRNAQDIAKRGAELYDKLAAFVADLEKVGKSLDSAQAAYGDAFKKFKGGTGNAIRQAEMLKALGVKPSKRFSDAALDGALPEAGDTGPAEPAPGLPAPAGKGDLLSNL